MADKLPFYKIGEANAEIERLNSVVVDRDKALALAQDEITALKATKPGDQSGEIATLTTGLAAEKSAVVALTGQMKAKDGEIVKLKADLEAASAKTSADASRIAAAITAAQGQPPIKVPCPNDKPAAGGTTGTLTERCLAANKVKNLAVN